MFLQNLTQNQNKVGFLWDVGVCHTENRWIAHWIFFRTFDLKFFFAVKTALIFWLSQNFWEDTKIIKFSKISFEAYEYDEFINLSLFIEYDEYEYENYEVDLEESNNKKLDKPSRKTFQAKFSAALWSED